jgi:phenylacetate-CoA ligase
MTMVWEPEKECMQRDELRQLQLEQLQAVLARVYMHVPFYRKQFDACKVDPDDFGSLDDLRRLPFTSRDDLQENYPYGLFAVPLRDVVRIHASACMSTVVGYTRNDIKTWSNLVARVLCAGGVGKDDVVQIAYGYDLSTGGLASTMAQSASALQSFPHPRGTQLARSRSCAISRPRRWSPRPATRF